MHLWNIHQSFTISLPCHDELALCYCDYNFDIHRQPGCISDQLSYEDSHWFHRGSRLPEQDQVRWGTLVKAILHTWWWYLRLWAQEVHIACKSMPVAVVIWLSLSAKAEVVFPPKRITNNKLRITSIACTSFWWKHHFNDDRE